MWFKLLMVVHLCAAFPLKCPEPAQWSLRANSHCTDPSKYFCLRNDLIKGYSENCTRSDFQQPGRKAVLRGGIDADICSVERYQPFPIKFFTNASTNCMFLKSFCNEEGQVVYDHGNRNTDATCGCDYKRGYDFIDKPNNQCFCKPSQEDCSCFLKTCSNTSHILSVDYQCAFATNHSIEIQCKPTTNETSRRPKIKESKPVENNISILVHWNEHAAITVGLVLSGTMVILLVLFRTLLKKLIWRYCCRVYFINDQEDEITSYEGEIFPLKYKTSKRQSDIKIYKDGTFIKSAKTLLILNLKIENGGLYHAECHCVRSKSTSLTVLPLTCVSPPEEMTAIEGEQVILKYKLPAEKILDRLERLTFYKNENIYDKPDNIVRHDDGLSFSLSMQNAKQEDAGNYFAYMDKFKSNTTKLTVQSMFTSSFDQMYWIEGEELQLKCSVYSASVEVEWFKDNANRKKPDKIVKNKSISIDHNGKDHVMTIQIAKITDSGQYIIIAGNVQTQFRVTVKAFFQPPLKDKTIMEGLEVSFECEAEKPFPIAWFKDNISINESSKFKIEMLRNKVHKLTIRTTTMEDKGKHRIQMTDKTDISCCSNLEVKEMPDAVKLMSDHDRNMFLKAAQSGTAVRYYIRIMIVGESGVGKTCLLRRLMKEKIDDVRSTDGINIEVKQCKINRKTQTWIFTSDEEFSQIAYQNEEFADCGFWDFAGQKEFYATHQTFLSTNAIYLLVVDISKDFEGKTHKDMMEHEFDKVGEYIEFWLDSIHCYALPDRDGILHSALPVTDEELNSSFPDKDGVLKSAVPDKSVVLNPPVIIIGSGIDKIKPSSGPSSPITSVGTSVDNDYEEDILVVKAANNVENDVRKNKSNTRGQF